MFEIYQLEIFKLFGFLDRISFNLPTLEDLAEISAFTVISSPA